MNNADGVVRAYGNNPIAPRGGVAHSTWGIYKSAILIESKEEVSHDVLDLQAPPHRSFA